MSIEYYNLPLKLGSIIKGDSHQKCLLTASIKQHIHLIITTSFGEMRFDDEFGCSIWDSDFDNLTSNNKLREKIKESILHSVSKYEKRIESVRVNIFLKEEELMLKLDGRHVKKRLDISLTANVISTSEPLLYQDTFFTGPLSYY
jgi:phage baseplate assembly protein W